MGFLHEHIILPLSDMLRGEQVHKYLRLLREAESWTPKQMQTFQQERLRKLIVYAAKEVPFYRDWIQTHDLNPDTITLDQLPIVSKFIMRHEGIDRFAAEHFSAKQRIPSCSSGSTGEPFSYYISKESNSVNTAAKLLTWFQADYRLGDRYMKIAYAPRNSLLKRLQDKVNNCTYLYFNSIDNEFLRHALDTIEHTRPSYIRCYPAVLLQLARFRIQHTEYQHNPTHLFTTGNTLTRTERACIETAFRCDVIDSYSCEGTPCSAETPQHDGYHTCHYYGLVEIINHDGIPISNGIGRIVSTDFWNYSQPFIRYDTNDMAEIRNGIITQIIGRSNECITTPSGKTITVYTIEGYFEHNVPSVESFQVVRLKNGNIRFNLVVNNQHTHTLSQSIVDYWEKVLETNVDITLMENIPLLHNNKRFSVVNE